MALGGYVLVRAVADRRCLAHDDRLVALAGAGLILIALELAPGGFYIIFFGIAAS